MKKIPLVGYVAAIWGLTGVVALVGRAAVRLTGPAIEGVTSSSLNDLHLLAGAGWVFFMTYAEGYKGFQLGFAPRVVLRALHLARNPRPLHVALAPAFLMGLFHASRKRMITSWSLVTGIFTLVMVVRHVAQPWRGIIDVGVVIGLVWGLVAVVAFTVSAILGRPPQGSPDLPAGEPEVSTVASSALA